MTRGNIDVVADFEADPTGATDSAPAWNAAIALAVGSGDPTGTTRRPVAVVTAPPGTFRWDSPVVARSIEGLHIKGVAGRTFIRPQGGIDTALDLDGVAHSVIDGLWFNGAGTVDKVVHLHWGAGTFRSVTDVTFRDIRISDLTFRVGFALGEDNANQLDEVTFDSCRVYGGWTAGNTTTWQYGFRLGNGNAGNNLTHRICGLKAGSVRRAVGVEGAGVVVDGGSITNCEDDFYHATPHGPLSVRGVRSEGSTKLYRGAAQSSACAQVHFDNCEWHGNNMADKYWADLRNSGMFRFTNCRVTNVGAYQPQVYGNQTGAKATVLFDNLAVENADLTKPPMSVDPTYISCVSTGYVKTSSQGAVLDLLPGPTNYGLAAA